MIGSIFYYFLQKISGFPGFFVFFVFSFFSVCFKTVFFGCFASLPKQRVSMFRLNRNKEKTHPNSLKVSIFFRKFRVVSVCFGLLRNSSICFGCFDIGSKHGNKPKSFGFGFTKQTKTIAKQIFFRFVSVRTEIYFCLFRGHGDCYLPSRLRVGSGGDGACTKSPRSMTASVTKTILRILGLSYKYPWSKQPNVSSFLVSDTPEYYSLNHSLYVTVRVTLLPTAMLTILYFGWAVTDSTLYKRLSFFPSPAGMSRH